MEIYVQISVIDFNLFSFEAFNYDLIIYTYFTNIAASSWWSHNLCHAKNIYYQL